MESGLRLREPKGKERMVFDLRGGGEDYDHLGTKRRSSLGARMRRKRTLITGVAIVSITLFILYNVFFTSLTRPSDPEKNAPPLVTKLKDPPAVVVSKYIPPAPNPPALPQKVEQTSSASNDNEASPAPPSATAKISRPPRQQAVVDAFLHAWHSYEKDAFGCDEYHPLSHRGSNMTNGHGFGYTVVDTLDTIILMDLQPEYERARAWVQNELNFDIDGIYNVFETTIRVLGGLLSAYSLTEDDLYIGQAKDLADRLFVAFKTVTGLPATMVNFAKRQLILDHANRNWVSVAEAGTLQLEFRYLAHVTGNRSYWDAAEKVMQVIDKAELVKGLAPIFMNPQTGQFEKSDIRLGSRGDSYYEYLLKQYLQTNLTELKLKTMYDESMDAIHKELLMHTPRKGTLHTGELLPRYGSDPEWKLSPKQDHLVCFLGGSLMLGAVSGHPSAIPPDVSVLSETAQRDWTTGKALIETCMTTHETATGLSPEIVYFYTKEDIPDLNDSEPDWYIKGGSKTGPHAGWDGRYSLRPETVESLFIAYRLTGDEQYREWGWDIFQAIEKHCKVPEGGYCSVKNVDYVPVAWDDKMETFFLSETLKYLYLLFDDTGLVPLSDYVFNTEAHPLPIFTPDFQTAFL